MLDRQRMVGCYRGEYRVREGRESELTRDEVKRFLKSKEKLDLDLRDDGTFSHKGVTHGNWSVDGGCVVFQPTAFGNQTREEMQSAAEESGRMFTLAFLFDPFQLRWDGEGFITPDEESLIYTVYQRK